MGEISILPTSIVRIGCAMRRQMRQGAHRQYMHRLETRAKRIERIGDHSDQKLPIAGAQRERSPWVRPTGRIDGDIFISHDLADAY